MKALLLILQLMQRRWPAANVGCSHPSPFAGTSMNLLALETATTHCSVALLMGSEQLHLNEVAPQKHAALLLPMVDKLMAQAGLSKSQLDAVAFGQGPGSFTGLRIAAAATQGIALGLDLPVAGVSTLAALAHQRYRIAGVAQCIACLDARMSEIYWGFYETQSMGCSQQVNEEQVGSVDELLKIINEGATTEKGATSESQATFHEVAGDGAGLLQSSTEANDKNLISDVHPQALDVALLALQRINTGDVVEAASALPVYLRNRVALTESERAQQKAK